MRLQFLSSRAVITTVLGLILVFIAGIGVAAPSAYQAVGALEDAQVALREASEALTVRRSVAETGAHIENAVKKFESARTHLRRIQYLRAVPWIGRQVKAAYVGASAAHLASGALGSALSLASEVSSLLGRMSDLRVKDISRENRIAILEDIARALPDLRRAKGDLERVSGIIKRTPTQGVSGIISDRLREVERYVNLAERIFSDALPLLEIGPALLGYPDPAAYLLILQNSDEMRPAGGFIGTYGLIVFDAGHITEFFTDDVYNLDRFVPGRVRPPAPAPIAKYLEQPRWFLRDANWSPDFPTSAQQILKFYEEEVEYAPENRKQKTEDGNPSSVLRPPSSAIDGVIAVMPEAIRPLLNLTGPIEVRDQIFTAENLTDALEYEVEIGFEQKGIPRPQRKEIIAELGHTLIAKVLSLPASKWPDTLHIVREALDEKHLMVYRADAKTQSRIETLGWGGKIADNMQDYLAVFDANLFSLKTDPYVTRSIFYRVYPVEYGKVDKKGAPDRSKKSEPLEVRPRALQGEVEVVYSYPKEGPAWKTKGYRSWASVYVPKGSILVRASGALQEEFSSAPGEVAIGQDSGKTVFSAFVAVQVGQTRRLKFIYRLPEYIQDSVSGGQYNLTVQKQPGTAGHALTVSVDFGKVPRIWEPRGLGAAREETKLTWQGSLRKDQHFRIEF